MTLKINDDLVVDDEARGIADALSPQRPSP